MKKNSFTHQIVTYSVFSAEKKVLLTRNYKSRPFSDFAKNWFDREVKHRYPDSIKIFDQSLCGYHYDTLSLIIELR